MGIHCTLQGYTAHCRVTLYTAGIHYTKQGYTAHCRDKLHTVGIHCTLQGYTAHCRDTGQGYRAGRQVRETLHTRTVHFDVIFLVQRITPAN